MLTGTASIVNPVYSGSSHLDAGSYSQMLVAISGADAANYTLPLYVTPTKNYTVGLLGLMVTGLTGTNKVYNEATADPLTGTPTIAPLTGDVVNLLGTGSGSFADANVGTAKPVTVTGYSLPVNSGNILNYQLVEPTGLTLTSPSFPAWHGWAVLRAIGRRPPTGGRGDSGLRQRGGGHDTFGRHGDLRQRRARCDQPDDIDR